MVIPFDYCYHCFLQREFSAPGETQRLKGWRHLRMPWRPGSRTKPGKKNARMPELDGNGWNSTLW